MHALDRCDFCDSDAVGTFATVSSDLEPTDAEQRRLLLCEGCRARLEEVLEPLIARLRDGAEPPTAPSGADDTADREAPTEPDQPSASTEVSFEPAENGPPADDSDERTDSPVDENGGADAPENPPDDYGAVIRLLRNRAEPMERSAVEDLAASAYDLESREVDAVIDHALERGDLLERDGTLRSP